MMSEIEIVPSGAALGAEVRGVDLSRPLSDAAVAAIKDAFAEHSVICIPGQDLTAPQFIDFMKYMGDVSPVPINDFAHPEHPEIYFVSNIQENGRKIGHDDAGSVWHTDMSFSKTPPRISCLYAREVPVGADGKALGDTHFASAAAAYDALTDDDKMLIEGKFALHDLGGRRTEIQKKNAASPELARRRKETPITLHPVARVHPVNGRKCLYVTRGECTGIDGMETEEALPLIERLARHVYREPFRFTHSWRVGDLLMWDNCAVQHVATFDYKWPEQRRLMWRITTAAGPTH
jgi:taurine dioxygenase